MKRLCMAISALLAAWQFTDAGDRGRSDTSEFKNVGLTVTLRSKKDSYKLDLSGRTLKEWEEMLKIGKKLGSPPPKPPMVDMELEVKNTTDKAIEFWSAGDPVQVILQLKGPNAKTINAPLAFTADFRLPKLSTLEPGKTFVIPIKTLQSGFRGVGTWHYWLAPGEYTISPSFKTGIRPAPPGSKEMEGAGAVTIVGKPLTVKVVE